MKRLILASGSPRRKQLLTRVSFSFDTVVSHADETVHPNHTPAEAVEFLARKKAAQVARRYPGTVVLGADTVVSIDGTILGKPADRNEAKKMLELLSGRTHEVFTGVAILSAERKSIFHTAASVSFWDLSEEEIASYIASGEPMDKAGGYGIQGLGSALVKEIQGDFYTIVGLPVSRTVRALRSFGVTPSPVTND
jgi:septum formation protein